jgi:uncharacterized protein
MDAMVQYRQTARRREAETRQKLLVRRERALRLAREAAELLRQEFAASRVALLGSLTRKPGQKLPVHAHSDIDLAGWGLAEADYLRAVSRLLDLSPIDIDLVRIEEATPRLRETIEKEGVSL